MLPFRPSDPPPPPAPRRFEVVKIVKPEASRSESSELYVYASQFKPALKGTREERGGTPGGARTPATDTATDTVGKEGGAPGGTGEGTALG